MVDGPSQSAVLEELRLLIEDLRQEVRQLRRENELLRRAQVSGLPGQVPCVAAYQPPGTPPPFRQQAAVVTTVEDAEMSDPVPSALGLRSREQGDTPDAKRLPHVVRTLGVGEPNV